jgi:uncharacterized protein (UPF0332 family)
MITSEIQHYLNLADESHEVARILMDGGHIRFSAAQSYYTFFYLAQAVLLTKGLTFSSHSAVLATYGREFAKTGVLDSKFHHFMITAKERREIGHYGDEKEELTREQALESLQWAEEFMQAVITYLRA